VSKQEEVYKQLKKKIIDNSLRDGISLNERDLCEMFSVSRTPVREALKKLAAESFIEFIPNIGAFVTTLSVDTLMEIYEVREALERMAIKLYMARANAEELKRLDACHEKQMAAFKKKDWEVFMAEDMKFHYLIALGTKNKRLITGIQNIYDHVRMVAISSEYDPEVIKIAVSAHNKIMKAIASKDAEKAMDAMVEHIVEVKNYNIMKRIG
jgi:DNA-binding GntR family transcriptional regulator